MSLLSEYANFSNGKKKPSSEGAFPVYGGNGVLGYADDFNMENGIIIGRVGVYCGSVYLEEGKCWVSDNAIKAENTEKSDLGFLYYLLRGLRLNEHQIGTSQPLLTQGILNSIEVEVPDIITQRKIAKVLSAIDKKIVLNKEISENLEQQACLLYRSMFETFERIDTVDRYDSDLGPIPEGWTVCTLGDVTENIRTKVKENSYRVLSAVNTGVLQPSDEYFSKQVFSKSISNYIVVEEDDFAYNPARVNIGSIGINDLGYTGCVSPVYVVFRTEPNYQKFMRFFIRTQRFKEEVKLRASGSVRQSMNYSDFAMISIAYPPKHIVEEFNSIYAPIYSTQKHIEKENQKLTEIRDVLLPRLLSGQVDVSDICV